MVAVVMLGVYDWLNVADRTSIFLAGLFGIFLLAYIIFIVYFALFGAGKISKKS